MSIETSQKVTASQLKRSALLYIRQSTARQVLEHTESTARQYALRKRAVALGWKDDQVMVIVTDAHLMTCRDVGPRAWMILFSI